MNDAPDAPRPAPPGFPAAGEALLAPYERTRPGYELCVSAASLGQSAYFPEAPGGLYEVNLWGLWKRADQAALDPDKQAADRLQLSLGPLSDDERFIRLQIACLARCYWTFPASLDLVLDGIASGRPNLTAGVSCEPPWTGLRQVLLQRRGPAREAALAREAAFHHQQGLDPRSDPRQKRLRHYLQILAWWTARGRLDLLQTALAEPGADTLAGELPGADSSAADLAAWVFDRLGPPDRLKLLLVQQLTWHLSAWAYPRAPAHLAPEQPGAEAGLELLGVWSALESAAARETGETGAAVARLIARNHDQGLCHHAFFRHVDHIIAHIGAGRPVTLPGAGAERQRVLNALAGYAQALAAWLADRPPAPPAPGMDPAEARRTDERVRAVLGAPTPRKRWLAACLWKKLLDDRAFAGRGPIDADPAAFALPPEALRAP